MTAEATKADVTAVPATRWHRIDEADLPAEGRVRTVVVDGRSVAMSRCAGSLGALENRCPHQGGPLGEGSIEKGWLRCPWHGYDYRPDTGVPPEGFSDGVPAYDVEERADGCYVALPELPAPARTVADVVVETLVSWGVTTFFGMVGHSNLGFAEALRHAEERGEITYVGIRHEGAAAFAASAFGKLTGRAAACVAIAGPGSTNLLTGLYDAKLDGAPVIAVSGQVPSSVLGRGAFQDLPLSRVFGDVAVSTTTLHAGSDHAELTGVAVKRALDRRGVAHLVLPDEVQVLPSEAAAHTPTGRVAVRSQAPHPGRIADAVALVDAARRPVLVVGHGAREARADVTALAEHLGAPVLTTFKAKGLVPDSHALGAGVLGRSGTPVASWLMNESDLVIAIGVSFSNHTGVADYKPIIQVDDAPEALGRFHPVAIPLLGDAGVTARLLLERTVGKGDGQRADVAARWAIWREEKQRRTVEDRGRGINAAAVFDSLGRHLPDDAVVCVDVGNHAYSLGRYLESRGQPVLMSGYLGSIGFGYPAAMGAWAADPSRPVLVVTGDGGFGQYAMEITTAVKYGMPIKHVLLDNHGLGKISKEQLAGDFPVWQTSLVNPDWAAFARLCGASGLTARATTELDAAVAALFATPGPALLHVEQDGELV